MIEIKTNDGKCGSGFDVLHSFCAWKLAFISFAEQYGSLKALKRHTETDEAFLLIKGTATLFYCDEGEKTNKTSLEKEKIYVVKKSTWHHLTVSRDALIFAIENSDTSKENTEIKLLNEKEIKAVTE